MPQKKPRTAYHHGDLRAVLIDAAIALIAKHGLAELSLRECARKAGVSHAAPMRHFENKASLLEAIADRGFTELAARGRASMVGLKDARARLDAYGVAYVRFAFENPVLVRVMFTTHLTHAPERSEPPPLGTPGADAFMLLYDGTREALGPKTSDADVLLGALSVWSAVHGLSMLIIDGRVPTDLVPDADGVEALARGMLSMLRGPLASARKR